MLAQAGFNNQVFLFQLGVFLMVILMGLACAFCGWLIGKEKDRGRQGFWLGFFFGPLGVMTIGFITPKLPEKMLTVVEHYNRKEAKSWS